MCNIDADNYTGANFANFVNSVFEGNRDIFLSTHHNRSARNDALGRICVRKKDFWQLVATMSG